MMDIRHRYCEANSVVERSHPEPESSVDLDNDDDDKLVIVEDPTIELSIINSSETFNASSTSELSRKFRGPKKKFLEAFVQSESIASESDSTMDLTVSASAGMLAKKGDAFMDVTCSSLTKEDRKPMPMPDSNDSNEKVCDSSTKLDYESDDAKKKDTTTFNLRSCIDLIIDSRLIRDRLNSEEANAVNEQYKLKFCLSRINEVKALCEVGKSSTGCKTLRDALSMSEETTVLAESKPALAKSVSSVTAAANSPNVSASMIRHEQSSNRDVYEAKDLIPASSTGTSSTQKSSGLAVGTQNNVHSPLHQIAALASLLPKQPIAMATEADKIVTGCGASHHQPIPMPKVVCIPTDNVPYKGPPKKPMPALIDTKISPPAVFDTDAYSGGQGYKTRFLVGSSTSPMKSFQNVDVDKPRYKAPPTHEAYYVQSNSSSGMNMAEPLSMIVEVTNQKERSSWGGGGCSYSSSGGQLVPPSSNNRSNTSQLSPGMPSSSASIWGAPQVPTHSRTQRQVSPTTPHSNHSSQYVRHYMSSTASTRREAIGSEPLSSPQGQNQKPSFSHLIPGSQGNQTQYGDRTQREYSGYPTKAPSHSSMVTSFPPDNRREASRQPKYGYEGHGYAPSQSSPGHYASRCPPPPLLYLPQVAAKSQSMVSLQSTELRHYSHTPSVSTSHTSTHSPTQWEWSQNQPKLSTDNSADRFSPRTTAPSIREAPLDLTTRWAPDPPPVSPPIMKESEYQYTKPLQEDSPLDLTVRKPMKPPTQSYLAVQDYGRVQDKASIPGPSTKVAHTAIGIIPCLVQPRVFAPVTLDQPRLAESPQAHPPLQTDSVNHLQDERPVSAEQYWEAQRPVPFLPPISLVSEKPYTPSISRGVIDPEVEKQQQTQFLRQEQKKGLLQQVQQQQLLQQRQLQQQHQQKQQQQQQQQLSAGARGQMKMSTTAQLLGNHPPHDILYLKCNVCTSTYGTLHSFRKHFWKVHGFGPTNEHVTVRSISATRGSVAKTKKAMDEIEKPVPVEPALTPSPHTQSSSDAESVPSSRTSPVDYSDQPYDMVHMQLQQPCTLTEMQHKMAPLSDTPDGSIKGDSAPKLDNNQSTMRCLQCGQDFPTRDWGVFRRHVRAHDQPTLRCTLCRQTFTNSRDLQEHNRTCHQDQMWSCHVCGVGFIHPGELGKHMKAVHPADYTPGEDYKCQLCPLVFDDVQHLLVHLNEHSDQPKLASRYAELLVPGSFNVRRASPDSTNDMVEQKVDLHTVIKQEAAVPDKHIPSEGSPSVTTVINASGKQLTVLSLPKKVLYEFIKDKVEHEARKQLGATTGTPSQPESAKPSPSTSQLQDENSGAEHTNTKLTHSSASLPKTSELNVSSDVVYDAATTASSKASELGNGGRSFRTMRDALHLLVEHAITHVYEQAGSGEVSEKYDEPNSKDNDSGVTADPGDVEHDEGQQKGAPALSVSHVVNDIDKQATAQPGLTGDTNVEDTVADTKRTCDTNVTVAETKRTGDANVKVTNTVANTRRTGDANVKVTDTVADTKRTGDTNVTVTYTVADTKRAGDTNVKVIDTVADTKRAGDPNVKVTYTVADTKRACDTNVKVIDTVADTKRAGDPNVKVTYTVADTKRAGDPNVKVTNTVVNTKRASDTNVKVTYSVADTKRTGDTSVKVTYTVADTKRAGNTNVKVIDNLSNTKRTGDNHVTVTDIVANTARKCDTDVKVTDTVADIRRTDDTNVKVTNIVADTNRSGDTNVKMTDIVADTKRTCVTNVTVTDTVANTKRTDDTNVKVTDTVADTNRTGDTNVKVTDTVPNTTRTCDTNIKVTGTVADVRTGDTNSEMTDTVAEIKRNNHQQAMSMSKAVATTSECTVGENYSLGTTVPLAEGSAATKGKGDNGEEPSAALSTAPGHGNSKAGLTAVESDRKGEGELSTVEMCDSDSDRVVSCAKRPHNAGGTLGDGSSDSGCGDVSPEKRAKLDLEASAEKSAE